MGKIGKWIFSCGCGDFKEYKCSECGRTVCRYDFQKETLIEMYPYCHCGAKMKEEN